MLRKEKKFSNETMGWWEEWTRWWAILRKKVINTQNSIALSNMILHYAENLKYNHSTGDLCNEKGEGKRPDHTILQGKTPEATEPERDWPVISHSKCIIWTLCTALNLSCLTLTLQNLKTDLSCFEFAFFVVLWKIQVFLIKFWIHSWVKGQKSLTITQGQIFFCAVLILWGLLKALHAELYIWCCSLNTSPGKCELIFRVL